MALKTKALHIGDILMDWSFLLFNFNYGRKTCIPIISYLITGSEAPILLDTGVREVSLFRATEVGFSTPEQDLITILKEEGLAPARAGKDHRNTRYPVYAEYEEGRRRSPNIIHGRPVLNRDALMNPQCLDF